MVSPELLVKAGLYPDEQSVIDEAMRILWRERPQLRVDWAIYRYQTEEISLAKAATLANVSYDRMKELLVNRGIQPKLGAETIEEAQHELTIVEQTLTSDS
mgnify:CR=1 FL=1